MYKKNLCFSTLSHCTRAEFTQRKERAQSVRLYVLQFLPVEVILIKCDIFPTIYGVAGHTSL